VDRETKDWKLAKSWNDRIHRELIEMTSLNLIGSSAKFQALLAEVARVAPVNSAVLIQGETDTGKEVIARAIHEADLG
jgi:transcriptional regulator with GAF, ATPase, and Fis domain